MTRLTKLSIILLRVVFGWFILYQGISAILNPGWSLATYIQGSKFFSGFYSAILSPSVIPYASYAAKGLLVLIGGALILGIFVRLVSFLGMLLMLFFYFPLLRFPYANGPYYIVDDHIIFLFIFFFLYAARAGEYLGLGSMFKFSRY